MNTSSLPPAVRALASRMKTRASLHVSHENHDLSSLSKRILLSPAETLNVVAEGKLLALDGPRNSKFGFSAAALDSTRNAVIDLVSREVVRQLSARGCDESVMLKAVGRAFEKQFELARGPVENVIEFDQSAPGSFVNGAAGGAGLVAGAGLAGYGAYRFLKNRKKNANGLPLPGPGGSGTDADSYIDVTPPGPRNPSGGAGQIVDATGAKHVGPPSASRPPLTTASAADADLLGDAVRKGRQAIAKRGSAVWKALRSIPFE
jgi:hypothetical protein